MTLQTVLMEEEEEEKDRESDSGGSVLDSWIKAASKRERTRVKRRTAEMVRVMSRGFLVELGRWG